ncbi:MAG: redox-regulated ATPase YchF [Calditrichaeota bacterium]|nr:redox-regulated ATPase YchF [Calditrichota bacterium]
MEVGIIGLPVSGKTTLFRTLIGEGGETAQRFGKVEVHRGVVKVPDRRLEILSEIFTPKKTTFATIEYIEVGGFEKDAARTRGIDSQILQVLKNTDALCMVIRAFENEYAPHPYGNVDPLRDIQILETEFLLSDLQIVENRIARLEKQVMKARDEKGLKELELLKRCHRWLETERPLREMSFTDDEQLMIRGFQFLSAKPVLLVVNIGETDIRRENEILETFQKYSRRTNMAVVTLCAKIEEEIAQLSPEDAQLFLKELGIQEPALSKMIRASYELLGLISFFTVGDEECRAWTIKRGTRAQKAAGAIHSDMERGFIRAEVVHFEEFMKHRSLARCREKGALRLEGKDYIVQDGDILTIRFNV